MSDWSNYLKKAVASVEQRLDQVLQDGSEISTFKQQRRQGVQEPQSETDMPLDPEQGEVPSLDGEPLNGATIDSSSQNVDLEEAAVGDREAPVANRIEQAKELKLITEDVNIPDTLALKVLAEKLASSALNSDNDQVNELAAELAEAAAATAKEIGQFNTSCKDRLTALHSRLELATKEYLNGEHTNDGAKLAQLLNEGQRLSRRELELGQQIRLMKARSTEDKKSVSNLTTTLQSTEQEVASLKAKLKDAESASHELKASQAELEKVAKANLGLNKEVEDLKIQLKAMVETHKEDRAKQRNEEFKLRSELQEALALAELYKSTSAQNDKEGSFRHHSFFEDESSQSDAWAEKEMQYLSTISSLEADLKSAGVREQRILEKVKNLETRLEEEKESHESLQLKVDSLMADIRNSNKELESSRSDYKRLESDLNSKIAELEQVAVDLREKSSSLSRELAKAYEEAKCTAESTVNAPDPPLSVMDRFLNSEIVADRPTPEPLLAIEEHKYTQFSQTTTRQTTPTFFSLGEPPQAESSLLAGDYSLQSISDHPVSQIDVPSSARYQVLSKLKLQVSKLESELVSAREASEVYVKERDSAKRELVELFEKFKDADAAVQEHEQCTIQIQNLESRISQLESDLKQKEEITSELQADISDLKEIHQDQINILIGELQSARAA